MASEVMDLRTVGAMCVLTLLQMGLAHLKGRRGDRRSATDLDKRFGVLNHKIDENQKANRRGFRRVDKRVTAVEHHLVGPDGKNGMRSRLEAIEQRLDDRDEKDRERLERKLDQQRDRGVATPAGFSMSPSMSKVGGGGGT